MSRGAHDAGDCWDGCRYCAEEDERAALEAEREHADQTGCPGRAAEATGICTLCGADLLGFWDEDDFLDFLGARPIVDVEVRDGLL